MNIVNFVHVNQHNYPQVAGEITPLTSHLLPFGSLSATKMEAAPLSQDSREIRQLEVGRFVVVLGVCNRRFSERFGC